MCVISFSYDVPDLCERSQSYQITQEKWVYMKKYDMWPTWKMLNYHLAPVHKAESHVACLFCSLSVCILYIMTEYSYEQVLKKFCPLTFSAENVDKSAIYGC